VSGFERDRRGGRIVATFTGFEADLLRSLAGQLVELLHNESALPAEHADPLEAMLDFSGPTTEPEDPVLARLFPTAYHDDADAAAEFRRFTEGTLRDGKAAAASTVIDTLEDAGLPPELTEDGLVIDVELDDATAETWLKSFTDVRLAVATRLGVEEGDEEYWETLDTAASAGNADAESARMAQVYGIYQWVGYLQETLVDALSEV
jgi:hypothetical protein